MMQWIIRLVLVGLGVAAGYWLAGSSVAEPTSQRETSNSHGQVASASAAGTATLEQAPTTTPTTEPAGTYRTVPATAA